jgi:tryptophan halogenase
MSVAGFDRDLVLRPVEGLGVRELPDGRSFVGAGAERSLVVGGAETADLRFVLDHLDGRRTVEEVLQAVARSADERAAVLKLLGLLEARELLVPVASATSSVVPGRRSADGPAPPAATPRRFPASASVGIVGGGTAGTLAALALRRAHPAAAVTLIESPDLPPIGVGEATTPLLPQFLHADLGLDVHRLFREVRPTLKLGIRFAWGSGPGFSYPFGALDLLAPAVHDGTLDGASFAALLMEAGALPLFPEEGGVRTGLGTEVAYHLDNRRFAAYLRERAREAGVERIEDTVERVELRRTGEDPDAAEVAALHTRDGRRLAFDLYVDCSGFRSLLVGNALGSPFVSYEGVLFTDAAVLAGAPHGGRLLPHTVATTREAGWSWRIPQEDGDHLGAVFSSAFTTPERALAELRADHPEIDPAIDPEGESPRVLRFRPGRRRHFVRGNAIALGNAYGFVEPLESTALHLLIRQIVLLVDRLPGIIQPGDRAGRAGLREHLDRRVAAHWDYVAWFLSLHFRFNRRLDTPFWRACRDEVDVARALDLAELGDPEELIEDVRRRGPLTARPAGPSVCPDPVAPDPLWGPEGIDLLLLGQGVPARLPRPAESRAAYRRRIGRLRALARRALPAGEAHRLLAERPELLEAFADAFRRRGPAGSARRPAGEPLAARGSAPG